MCIFLIIKFASVASALTIMMSLKFFATQPDEERHGHHTTLLHVFLSPGYHRN